MKRPTLSSKDLAEPTRARAEAAGHRADVRAAALSPDDATLVTCSHKGVKVWDPEAERARTIEGGYGLCVLFAPGEARRGGNKTGALELFDAHAGTPRSAESAPDAHGGAVWGMAALPRPARGSSPRPRIRR